MTPETDARRDALGLADAVLRDMDARLVWSTDIVFRERIKGALAAIAALHTPSPKEAEHD